MKMSIETRTDSSAAKGIQTRRGCGKVKHLQAKQLWVQERVQEGDVKVKKVPRAINPSDVMSHSWAGTDYHHFAKMCVVIVRG